MWLGLGFQTTMKRAHDGYMLLLGSNGHTIRVKAKRRQFKGEATREET
jgi:hypothetical protein